MEADCSPETFHLDGTDQLPPKKSHEIELLHIGKLVEIAIDGYTK